MAFYASMLLCNLKDDLNQSWCSVEVPQKQCGIKWGGGDRQGSETHPCGERSCLTVLFLNFSIYKKKKALKTTDPNNFNVSNRK